MGFLSLSDKFIASNSLREKPDNQHLIKTLTRNKGCKMANDQKLRVFRVGSFLEFTGCSLSHSFGVIPAIFLKFL